MQIKSNINFTDSKNVRDEENDNQNKWPQESK